MVLSKQYNFWFIFALLSFVAAVISYQYANQVFSFVNLSVTTNRQQILEQAKQVAHELDWDLTNYHDVTSFDSQDDLQCFVELEGGGKDAFVAMFQSGTYYPYFWNVRFFKEKEIVEMHLFFSPQGQKLGFVQKIAEQTSGAALTQEEAQALVEQSIGDWCPSFAAYRLVEYSNEVRDTGRIDHNFMYERTDIALGKGLYRFSAVVSGNTITKLQPSVRVPDNFMRRYQEMRSANILLASVGIFFFKFIYILLLSLLGLIFFYRRNYLLLKSSAYVACCIAGGMFLSGLNTYSLSWVFYNTIQSSSTFIVMNLLGQVITFVSLFIMIFFTLAIAEAAGRFVYKQHVQFFQIFSLSVLGSCEVVQQLILGYLCVPFLFLYQVVFHYITKNYCNWWSPANSLFDPNIIASFFPWLEAICKGVYAGFFEEIMFRALPFAMTAVLTRNSKHKKFWFIVIFIAQALIFSICHANYPNQPSYARLIEIIPVSWFFAWMYLQFGLLPGIITHFVYDAIWFAMPIFTSSLWWSKIIVVMLISLPLWIIFGVYIFHKKFYDLPAQYFNQAFAVVEPKPFLVQPRRVCEKIPAQNIRCIVLLGFVGLLSWAMTYKFQPDVDSLLITRTQAIEIARQAVCDKFDADLDDSWTAVAMCQDDCGTIPSRFIWQKYGKQGYDLFQGSYLSGISWKVSFLKFSGPVEDRAQEYTIGISSSHVNLHADRQSLLYYPGHIMQAHHKIPEHFSGADIDQSYAENCAYKFIEQEYGIKGQDLNLISVHSDKFEDRRDWTLIFQDMQVFSFKTGGQARIKIIISGDKVTSFSRFIFVPEDFDRAEQELLMNINIFKMALSFLMCIFIAISSMFGISWISRSQYGMQIFQHKALFIGTIFVVHTINSFSMLIATFMTAAPFYDQLTQLVLGLISSLSWQLLFYSMVLTAGAIGFVRAKKSNMLQAILLAGAASFVIVGISSFINFYQPYLEPVAGAYGSSAHWISTVAFSGECLKKMYVLLSLMIGMFIALKTVRQIASFWLWQLLVSVLFFMTFQAIQVNFSIVWMLMHGILIGVIVYFMYYLILQYDMSLLPLMCGIIVICSIVPELMYPSYYGAVIDGLIAIGAVIAASLFFYWQTHVE